MTTWPDYMPQGFNPAGSSATGSMGAQTPASQANAAAQQPKSSGNPFTDVLNHVQGFNAFREGGAGGPVGAPIPIGGDPGFNTPFNSQLGGPIQLIQPGGVPPAPMSPFGGASTGYPGSPGAPGIFHPENLNPPYMMDGGFNPTPDQMGRPINGGYDAFGNPAPQPVVGLPPWRPMPTGPVGAPVPYAYMTPGNPAPKGPVGAPTNIPLKKTPFAMTATASNGHRIGSYDGYTWRDMLTGEVIK